MTFLNFQDDKSTALVLDTSVMINLHASGRGEQILDALPNPVLVPSEVKRELSLDPTVRDFLVSLFDKERVEEAILTEREVELFSKLVTGVGSLEDGEAATVAISVIRPALPFIDEKKGRSRALEFGKQSGWSLDLILHPLSTVALASEAVSESVFLALRRGRMRIPAERCEQVVDLIGVSRAMECTSLPNYKVRRRQWLVDAVDL